MRVVVTGAAGMIGSNLVHGLNRLGAKEVIAVDDLTDGPKYRNLLGSTLADYFDKDEFYRRFAAGELGHIDAILHEGACSDTMEHDGKYMLETNYRCSKTLLDACLAQGTRLLYASSAATYGASETFREEPAFEAPLNVYGYSKLLFDQVVRRYLPTLRSQGGTQDGQVVGFRYFNVYGPREQHKGSMASVAFHLNNQVKQGDNPKLFEGCDGFPDGGQMRDFIYVDDVCKVNLWFWQNPQHSGIFNCGTGRAEPFQNVAEAVIKHHQQGAIEYIPFPDHLKGRYQSFTQADLTRLRGVGYDGEFKTVAEGVADYMAWLNRA